MATVYRSRRYKLRGISVIEVLFRSPVFGDTTMATAAAIATAATTTTDGRTTWLGMFETLCARYKCRPIEEVSADTDDDLCLSGPGGVWLAEITSVEFDGDGALLETCCSSLRRFGRRVMDTIDGTAQRRRYRDATSSTDGRQLIIAVDRFMESSHRSHLGERRQCLVKTCRNSATVTVMLLVNTVRRCDLPPNGLAFSRHNDRLRPFAFFLACELIYRRVDFELLNMHYEPMRSAQRWCANLAAASTDGATTRSPSSDECCWLDVGRDVHSRAKWLRVTRTTRPQYDLLDKIVTQRSPNSGRIQYLWREGRSLRLYGVNLLADGTMFNLSDLDTELHSGRPCVLRLCDFDTFDRRCGNSLLYRHEIRDLMTFERIDENGVDVANDRRRRSMLEREKRYYIDHRGILRCSRFLALS